MSRVYFTSDLHIGHRGIERWRTEFENVQDHDEHILSTLQKQCRSKRDTLYILGDAAMDRDSLYSLADIPCKKILVRGNHDTEPIEDYLHVFTDVYGFRGYKQLWLSHCPIHPQEMYRKKANIHGHIHANTNSPILPFPYINVNWDFWKRALTSQELQAFVKAEHIPYEHGIGDNYEHTN